MNGRAKAVVAALMQIGCTVAFGADAHPAEITPQTRFVWSSYMICFPLDRDFSKQFHDRPLDRPPTDGTSSRLVDLRNAADAGFDGLSIDLFIEDKYALPAFRQLVALVKQNSLPLGLSPMFDGLGRFDVTVDAIVEKVQAWFREFADEPCVVRCQGKPVILTYAPYGLPPDKWQEVLGRLHDAGCDGYWIGEYGRYCVLGPEPTLDEARPWLSLFPGANSFPELSAERTKAVVDLYRQACPDGQWVGSTKIGYWRPEIAVYHSQQGTKTFRGSWQAMTDCGVNWVQQATWNDFSENHHVMPSENYGTAFCELNRYLARQWKGLPADLDGPKLYLSQQQEVLTGEDAQFELLALLRPGDVPARVDLTLKDGGGATVKTFDPVTLKEAGLQTVELSLPLERIPAGGLLFPEAALRCSGPDDGLDLHGPYTIVGAGGYRPERNYSWLHTPASRQLDDVKCRLTLDGCGAGSLAQAQTKGVAALEVESPGPLADVEVLHNGTQVFSLRRDAKAVALASPLKHETHLAPNRRGVLDWGWYAARAVTTDGRLATSLPVFVERPAEAGVTVGLWTFDSDTETAILDSSPWLHDGRLGARTQYEVHRPQHAPDQWGGKCLAFDGVDDRVLLEGPVVPPNTYTVECWVKWPGFAAGGPKGQLIFSTANAAVVLGIGDKEQLRVSRHTEGRWYLAQDPDPLPTDQWTHVAVTYDGKTMRLYRDGSEVAKAEAPGDSGCGQVAIGWNSVTNGGFFRGQIDEVRVSAKVLRPEEFGPHHP
jgi:hypothetical protein